MAKKGNLKKARGIPIAVAFIVSVALLVTGSMAILYVVGYEIARRNTEELMRQRSGLILTLISERIDNHLQPAVKQLEYLSRQISDGRTDPNDSIYLGDILTASLAATPQISVVAFVTPDLRVMRAFRNRPDSAVKESDWSDDPVFQRLYSEAAQRDGAHWGELFVAESVNQTYINLRLSVHQGDKLIGVLIAGVSISELSDFLSELRDEFSDTTFILYGRNHVLAHPTLVHIRPQVSDQQPLPKLQDLNDPVLSEIWTEARRKAIEKALAGPARIRVVEYLEQTYVITFRAVEWYGETPWIVGSYALLADVAGEYERLRFIPIVGLGVLALALVVTYFIARAIIRPIRRLTDNVAKIRDLNLDNVPVLPLAPFRELNQAASGFNAMVESLKWFESYVPRTLVRRLLRQRNGGQIASEEREMTILFTDIQGFTSLAERMEARELASLLNQHFTIVDKAIEAEGGTVDKYLGDGAMAFWGAPERQVDHAARACRAAASIIQALEVDNMARRRSGKSPIRTRIGVHTGRVVVGNIGAPSRINYTVVGDAVNIAERVLELAREVLDGGDRDSVVCLSGQTVAQLDNNFHVTPLGQKKIRGHHEPIEVFQLV